MIVKFQTETGSIYEINYGAKTWRSIKRGEVAGKLRTESGNFHFATMPPEVGTRVHIVGPPLEQNNGARIVSTSPVVKILKDEAGELARDIVASESLGG